MPAYARGPPPREAGAWRNDARYSNHLQPPSGPARGMPPAQAQSAHTYPSAFVPVPVPVAAVSASTPIPDSLAIPTFSHIHYFTAIQLETLYARRRGARMAASTWQTNRDIATGFIQSVASRLGFPQRTIATAQQIYQRFHLFYPPSDFVLHEIAVASLFVAAKLNDTHKKPRDLLLASYALRFPQLVKGSSSASETAQPPGAVALEEHSFPTLAGTKRKHATTTSSASAETASPKSLAMAIGSVGEADIDPAILETDRKRLMALEKLILESVCFNFHTNASIALRMVIKLGRRSGLSKSFIRTAWKVAADMFRTSAPMQYPPNVIAVASLYGAALLERPPPRTMGLSKQEQGESTQHSVETDDALIAFLRKIKSVSIAPAPSAASSAADSASKGAGTVPLSETFPGCDADCAVHVEDVEEAVHELLDLYLSCAAQLPPSLFMTSAAVSAHPQGSAAATPSPLSPADPMDAYTASPSSNGSETGASARKKLKQYEYSPPPFGLVDWLNSSRCAQLQASLNRPDPPRKNLAAGAAGQGVDPTAPTKELAALLTDLKIYLRGIEYDRQRADDAFLAEANLLAHVHVEPLPGTETPVGMLGAAAHSVAVTLQPLDTTSASIDPAAKLDATKRGVVDRIQRRKLASALRLTFVEPEIERRPPPPSTDPAKQASLHHQLNPPLPAKRTRIEQAKRYLF